MSPRPRPQLASRIRRADSISPAEVRAMHALFVQFYENADLATFLKDLSEKTAVLIVHEKNDRSAIVGFSTVKTVDLDDQGKRAIGVFSGDTILHPDYWGDRSLKDAFAKYVLKLYLTHPRTPIYWLLISKGYKTYLLLAKNFVRFYPRQGPVDFRLRGLIRQYCELLFPDAWDSEREVLDFGDTYQKLRDTVAPIDPALTQADPDIAFFEERNPGWRKGIELPCIGEISLALLWPYLQKEAGRTRSSAPPPAPVVPLTASADGDTMRPPSPEPERALPTAEPATWDDETDADVLRAPTAGMLRPPAAPDLSGYLRAQGGNDLSESGAWWL